MPRYALKIEYAGTLFFGWQAQKSLSTVQGALEAALSNLEPNNTPRAIAAGRTDAGVHARGQVVHCDLQSNWEPFRLSEALNYHLKPLPVSVIAASTVDDDWHARFSAVERHYIYRLLVRRAPAVLENTRLWQVKNTLTLAAMQQGANHLIGKHDFTTFRSSVCQAHSPVKTLNRLDINATPHNNGTLFTFDIRARSFLHNQVRSLVGSLERVGAGSWPPEKIKAALKARKRAACGPIAPPEGLYLAHVAYENNPFIS